MIWYSTMSEEIILIKVLETKGEKTQNTAKWNLDANNNQIKKQNREEWEGMKRLNNGP